MKPRPESDEILVKRMLPNGNPNPDKRAEAWEEWQAYLGEAEVLRFIQFHNHSMEPDEDILQETLLAAYIEVERGRYQPRAGVPFVAYVKGIARNKIREARRRDRSMLDIDEMSYSLSDGSHRQPEATLERHEQEQALWQGLSQLPRQRRQVLEHLLSGESTAEIAGTLAMSEELVRQHKSRGLRSLRQMSIFTALYPGQ